MGQGEGPGDMSGYKEMMSKKEADVVAKHAKDFFGGDEDSARKVLRGREEHEATIENEKFDEVRRNLERPAEEVFEEAKAVQNIATKMSMREQGADAKPIPEDYEEGQRIIDAIGAREQNTPFGNSQQEVIDRNAKENEQRKLISEDLKKLILEVARSKFSDFLKQYIDAKVAEEKSLGHRDSFIAPEEQVFWKDFEGSVLGDSRLKDALTGNEELQGSVKIWAARFYAKELKDYMDRNMGADNYSI